MSRMLTFNERLRLRQDLAKTWSRDARQVPAITVSCAHSMLHRSVYRTVDRGRPRLALDDDLSVDRVDDVLVVPFTALQDGDEGNYHACVAESDRVRLHQVSIGLTSLNLAQVLSGLAEGERVILSEVTPLRDAQAGQSVCSLDSNAWRLPGPW